MIDLVSDRTFVLILVSFIAVIESLNHVVLVLYVTITESGKPPSDPSGNSGVI
jgi:hypothetical protein